MWRQRLIDIRERRPTLTPADLDNTATFESGFNAWLTEDLIAGFTGERAETLSLLGTMDAMDETRTSLHPRLQQPMRVADLAYFVAEHDDPHLAIIRSVAYHPSS